MTRRTALGAIAAATLLRAERFRVYARCLPDHLAELARESYERRNRAIAALRTPEAIRARQAWVRKTFWDLVGGEPERTPLNAKTVGSFARPGYRVEKIAYSSSPGVEIAANLYIPADSHPPFPGVLFQMGHAVNGKASETYQKCCQGLARLGYLVLAFDPMGQGERTYYRTNNADEEHSRAGRQMLLVGDTATRYQTWDAVRSLDLLASHPLVDPRRLASTGQSGGGTLTMLLAAVDDRLSAAAVSCGNTENFICDGFIPPGATDDAEQNFIGGGPLGFDRWDTLYPFAPKPLLITVSERDSFGTYSPNYIRGGEEEFAKLQRVYTALGAADRLVWKTTALPHALSHPLRVEIYRFFERHLRGSDKVVEEPELKVEPDETLRVGVAPARVQFTTARGRDPKPETLRSLLKLRTWPDPAVKVMARDRGESYDVETVEVQSAASVWLPAYVFLPREAAPKRPLLMMFEPGGRTRRWREGDLYPSLAAAGFTVCAFDVRGIGDLSPEIGRGNPYYTRPHASEEAYAWASLMLGEPLLGQRVADILAAVQAIAKHLSGRKMVLAALGSLCVPALCATALEPGIEALYLAGGLGSWSSILDGDEYDESFANFLPGVLRATDLPHIARSIAPRRMVVAGAVDARGKPLPEAAVRDLYGTTAEVRPTSGWSVAAFSSL